MPREVAEDPEVRLPGKLPGARNFLSKPPRASFGRQRPAGEMKTPRTMLNAGRPRDACSNSADGPLEESARGVWTWPSRRTRAEGSPEETKWPRLLPFAF